MDQHTNPDHDQTDEDILTLELSDEALERMGMRTMAGVKGADSWLIAAPGRCY